MDLTYSIRAHDGQTYGPYSLEDIQDWIREGRINADTPVNRSDATSWQRAGNYPEIRFSPDPGVSPPDPVAAPVSFPGADSGPDLSVLKSGASWFYWIAGLTTINFISWLSGGSMRFVVGTALVDVINAVGENAGKRGLAIALDVLLIGFFVVCGIFAHKGHLWAFALGLAVYLLDTILCLVAQEWIGLAFHIWALFSIASAMRLAWLMRR